MKIDVACGICSYKYRVPPEKLGQQLRCKQCETKFVAQEYEEPAEEDDSPDALTQLKEIAIRWGTAIVVLSFLGGIGWLSTIDPELAALQYKLRAMESNLNRPKLQQPGTEAIQSGRLSTSSFPHSNVSGPSGRPQVTSLPPKKVLKHEQREFIIEADTPFHISQIRNLTASELSEKYKVTILPIPPFKESQDLREHVLTHGNPSNLQSVTTPNQLNYTRHIFLNPSGKTVENVSQLQPGQLILALDTSHWRPLMVFSIESDLIKLRNPHAERSQWPRIYTATIDQLQLAHDGIDDLVHVNMKYDSPDQVPWKVD